MRISRLFLVVTFLIALPVSAGDGVVQYSADIVESGQGGEQRQSRIFVGDNRMRMEMTVEGSTMVQVVNAETQTMLIINPKERTYMQRASGTTAGKLPAAGQSGNPCEAMKNLDCRKLGSEQVNGFAAEKWEVRNQAAANGGAMLFWIDEKRGFPIRQVMPDGSRMELVFSGEESVAGRKAEKWTRTMTGADGQSLESHLWYDPELRTNIREEQPEPGLERTVSISVSDRAGRPDPREVDQWGPPLG